MKQKRTFKLPVSSTVQFNTLHTSHSAFFDYDYIACVHGSTNGTNSIPISFKVIPVVPLVQMVMPMVPFALPMVLLVPLVSQWCHWLPMMVPLVKLPTVPLGEPRTEPIYTQTIKFCSLDVFVYRFNIDVRISFKLLQTLIL